VNDIDFEPIKPSQKIIKIIEEEYSQSEVSKNENIGK